MDIYNGEIVAYKIDDKQDQSLVNANVLNLPVVVIRKDNKVTEGSTVSINYVSGSSRKIETMVLSKRTLAENSNVLVVDDFMRAGGSINDEVNGSDGVLQGPMNFGPFNLILRFSYK
ncbi:phosphoribosyltransferase family protein, partial [Streptomyces rimosus]